MTAALFPGQGSQFVGMGKSFFDEFQSFRETLEEASDTNNIDYKKMCFEGPESDLTLTENTQPCLLTISYGIFEVIRDQLDFAPSYGAGHSLGEYSALVSAGSFEFADAVAAVKARGRFMQEAVPVGGGGMAAVLGLEDEEVIRLCQWAEKEFGGPVEPANFNSPGQVVISGNKSSVEKAIAHFDSEKILGVKKRVKLIPLNVSAPFHCTLMKPAQEKMALLLDDMAFSDAEFGIIQNVNAKESVNGDLICENLIEQISSPVLWTQSMAHLKNLGIKKIIECGPGKVLSGLVKKIDPEMATFNVQTLEDFKTLEKDRDQWLT